MEENSKRFDYNDNKRRSRILEKENLSIQEVASKITRQLLTVGVVLVAILITWFLNYPSPPISPIVHQWQTMGQNFQYKGYQIFYFDKTTNATSGRTLLYLHGFPTSSFDMYAILPELQAHFERIVAPDMIGFGFSSKPKYYDYSIMDQANLVSQLVELLDLKNVHILAHDYGDTVAQELMDRSLHGQLNWRFDSVCMMNGGVLPSQHRPILMQKLLRLPIVSSVLQTFSNYYFFGISFSRVFGPNTKPSATDLSDLWMLIRIEDGYRVWGALLSYIDERLENADRWVGAIRYPPVPLHFIYGPADPVNPPPFADVYRSIVPKASLDSLDPSIGHYPQLEAPSHTMQSYSTFLASLSR